MTILYDVEIYFIHIFKLRCSFRHFVAILLLVRKKTGSKPPTEPTLYESEWAIGESYYGGKGDFIAKKFYPTWMEASQVPDYVNKSSWLTLKL